MRKMFDFEKLSNKVNQKVLDKFDIENNKDIPKWAKRFMKFYAFKVSPFLLNITGFIVLIFIFGRINSAYGFERVVMVGFVIVIFTLRSLSKKLNPD